MADVETVGPTWSEDAPWGTPVSITSVNYLKSLADQGLNVNHDSGDLGKLIQSAFTGVKVEFDQHLEFLNSEHIEFKTVLEVHHRDSPCLRSSVLRRMEFLS